LKITEADLNTKRMLDLMAVSQNENSVPLYLHVIHRILRDMRIAQQENGKGFSYAEFKRNVGGVNMAPGQLGPLSQRLEMLESFMPKAETKIVGWKTGNESGNESRIDWTNKVTISPPMPYSSNLTSLGPLPYYCRPFLPMYDRRERLCSLQYMFEYLLTA
jgi:hypothetical protein